MKRNGLLYLIVIGLSSSFAIQGWALERSGIPEKYHWKTDDIYPSLDAWTAAFDSVHADIGRMEAFQGRLGQDHGASLAAFNALGEEVDSELSRIVWFAYYNFQVDMRDPFWTECRDKAFALWSEYYQRMTWIEPELLSIPKGTLFAWTDSQSALRPYRLQYQDMHALRAHSLSEPEERIMALAGELAGGPNDTYTTLMSVDMDFPPIVDERGDTVKTSATGWRESYRTYPDRSTREKYFRAVFGTYQLFSNTCATTIASQYKTDAFFAKARNFGDCLDATLSPNFIPTEIFHNLIRSTRANTAPFQKYLAIRKRVLGVDSYHVWDDYIPLGAADEGRHRTWEAAAEEVVDAVQPLGKVYADETRFILDPANGLVDPFTSPGKINGAWSHNSLNEPARMLFNFDYANGLTLANISTIAHEAGHSLQANYTMRNQPAPLRKDISLVAEVPSVTVETLYYLKNLETARTEYRKASKANKEAARQRLVSLLDQILSKGVSGYFRQVMFAEWELEAHRLAENGEPITNESLTRIYSGLLKDYFGATLETDELTDHMWASVPHFYYGFYTYSYAVGEVAATALASDIIAESRGDRSKRGTIDRYILFLKAGSSKHPDELLRDAGVDMATAAPIETFIHSYSQMVDEFDQLTQAASSSRHE